MLVLCSLGILATITALVPVISILPILLYIGMLIGSQAFQETPPRHAPAIILALIPQIASWAKSQIDNALGAAGTSASKVGVETLIQNSVLYDGMSTLGGGATLVGIIIGSVTVFMIDQKFVKAAAFAMAGAVLTFFGLMHSDAIGFAMTPKVAGAYLFVGVVLLLMAKFATVASKVPEVHHPHAMSGDETLDGAPANAALG
jgi:AGZA family xanthine/uracil permease-like MFS transporter